MGVGGDEESMGPLIYSEYFPNFEVPVLLSLLIVLQF